VSEITVANPRARRPG